MSLNIAITASFKKAQHNNFLRENYLVSSFKCIQKTKKQPRFFALNWWSLQPGGIAEVLDLFNGEIIPQYDIRSFDLVHIFKLGYHPIKEISLMKKWLDFESRLAILNAANIICINSIETLKYLLNKEYLFYLKEKGLPIIQTKKIATPLNHAQLLKECGDFYKIIKPINGECGRMVRHITHLSPENILEYNMHTSDVLLQPYIHEVQQGEISIIYICKKFSHAVIKVPGKNNFKANGPHVGAWVSKYDPSAQEINLGLQVMQVFPKDLEIFRLDYVKTKLGPLIMEIEALDPNYYTDFNEMHAKKLYTNYIDYLKRKSSLNNGFQK